MKLKIFIVLTIIFINFFLLGLYFKSFNSVEDIRFWEKFSDRDMLEFLEISKIYEGFDIDAIDLEIDQLKNESKVNEVLSLIEEYKNKINSTINGYYDFGNKYGEKYSLFYISGDYSYENFVLKMKEKYNYEVELLNSLNNLYSYTQENQKYFNKNGVVYNKRVLSKLQELDDVYEEKYNKYWEKQEEYNKYIDNLFLGTKYTYFYIKF